MNRILVLDPESPEMRQIVSLLSEAEDYEPVSVANVTELPELCATASAVLCAFDRHAETLAIL